MAEPRLVLLGIADHSTAILYHALARDFTIAKVILESRESTTAFLSRRVRRLGIWKVTGQVLFRTIIVPVLRLRSARRIQMIREKYELKDDPIPEAVITRVRSANGSDTEQILRAIDPDFVIISGTRILSHNLLRSIRGKFINVHAGITPAYRGVHGAYWAIASNDAGNAGVTIHEVDKGIDTGRILAQEKISFDIHDNFITYPWIQTGTALPLLKKTILRLHENVQETVAPIQAADKGRLWFHPTIWEYFYGLIKGRAK